MSDSPKKDPRGGSPQTSQTTSRFETSFQRTDTFLGGPGGESCLILSTISSHCQLRCYYAYIYIYIVLPNYSKLRLYILYIIYIYIILYIYTKKNIHVYQKYDMKRPSKNWQFRIGAINKTRKASPRLRDLQMEHPMHPPTAKKNMEIFCILKKCVSWLEITKCWNYLESRCPFGMSILLQNYAVFLLSVPCHKSSYRPQKVVASQE